MRTGPARRVATGFSSMCLFGTDGSTNHMSTYISHTTAMLAAKFDPSPWAGAFADGMTVRWHSNVQRINGEGVALTFDPRPEFIPSRHTRLRTDGRVECADTFEGGNVGCLVSGWCILRDGHSGDCEEFREVWPGADEPFERPEPNPILVAFREDDFEPIDYLIHLDQDHKWHYGADVTPEHVEHARKVLTRLTNLTKEAHEHDLLRPAQVRA